MRASARAAARALILALSLAGAGAPLGAQSARCADRPAVTATRVAVGTAFVGANAALYEYFRRAWWSGQRADHFWINWEHDQPFRGQDKLGHALGGYHLARASDELLRLACVREPAAIWWGAAYAAAFQLQIEIWDGLQQEYGFSPPDLVANTTGAALAVAQHYHPRLRALKPTISYNPTAAYEKRLGELRPTVDYSGQTYWLSVDVDSLLPAGARAWWPGLLRLSVGHSITDWVDPATGREQRAEHKLVLSLDLDPERLPGDNRVWRRVKHELSYYRFPAPALVLSPRLDGVAWYR